MSEMLTPGQYIQHHLEHLTLNLKTFTIGEGGGFWTLNLDTLFFKLLLAFLFLFLILRVAASATSGVPGRFQALVEIIVELVEDQSKSIVHNTQTVF